METVRGRTFYYNTATEEQKDELTQEERNLLAPTVDPYNNELIQPLKVIYDQSCVCMCDAVP